MTTSGRITLNVAAFAAPQAPSGKYRSEQRYLMQPVAYAFEPSRVPGGAPLRREGPGPTIDLVGANAGAWDRRGGDWLDADLVRHGPRPWFSVLTNAIVGNSAEADYSVDCTAVVQAAQSDDRWMALLLRMAPGGAQRVMAGKFSNHAPSIAVTYVDGSAAVLSCRVTAAVSLGKIPNTTAATMSLPVFAEFERPVKAVRSATLRFRIMQHWSGSNTAMQGFLLDPPVNTSQVQLGIAATQSFDVGLPKHASVIHVHRYVDGSTLSSFVYSEPVAGAAGYNFSAELAFDPAIYETGPTDLTKFPHVGLGKWVGAPIDQANLTKNGQRNTALWTFVNSTYANEGFVPLAPGMGAIRMLMRRGHDVLSGDPIADGGYGGYGGTNGGAARLFLPEPRFGRQKRVFVRQYVRIGTLDGGPYVARVSKRYEVYKDKPPAVAVWTNLAGKCFAGPSHDTTFGGFSGTAGGYYGTNFRLAWHETDEVEGGPDEGGWGIGVHVSDYGDAQPAGHRLDALPPQDQSLGQKGGLGGVLYAHRWYCLESEVDLNSVQDTYPGFSADGVYRMWLDGRLCYELTGAVFRQNPPYSGWRTIVRRTGFATNQFSQARIHGIRTAKGYAGVTVRHSGVVNGAGYTAFVSRTPDNKALVVLVKRSTLRLGEQLAVTDKPLAWSDGDMLKLEATGTNPTVLTVWQNDTKVLSFTDTADSAYRANTRLGAFGASNDSASNGWLLDEWSGGTTGSSTERDSFGYRDGLVTSVSDGNWLSMDSVGTGWISSGKLWFPRAGGSLTFNRQLAARPIREIGHRDILFNWFHGGLTQNNVDRVIFMTGLVVSDSYVGPMRLT